MVHHVNKGVYVEQLQRWFEIFARDMFLVFTLEHFLNDAVAVYHDVCYFMNVRAYGSHQLKKRYNEGTNPSTEATRIDVSKGGNVATSNKQLTST